MDTSCIVCAGNASPKPHISTKDRILSRLAWAFDKGEPFDVDEMSLLLPAAASVVDLGCGRGDILARYRDLGCDVLGVDPDEAARNHASVPVLAGTAEHLPAQLNARQFDQVIMTHSLDHCIDPPKAVANAFSLTRPGGYFYCEVTNCGSTHFKMLDACALMPDASEQLHFFDPGSLARLIKQAGFRPLQTQFWGFARQYLPDWRAWEAGLNGQIAGVRHSYVRSLWLLMHTAFAQRRVKYDCVGILARRPRGRVTFAQMG